VRVLYTTASDGPAGAGKGASSLTTYERRLCQAALLAPQLQQSILDGTQPVSLTLERLINEDPPLAWADQIALAPHREVTS